MCPTMTLSLLRHNINYGGYSQEKQSLNRCLEAAVEDSTLSWQLSKVLRYGPVLKQFYHLYPFCYLL